MKIYFAGSIRGGREDLKIYQQIIAHLQQFGCVLSEHVGSENLDAAGETGMNDNDIFIRDINWLSDCDLVIAEVTAPSLGVGYELGKAEFLQKPVLCLFNAAKGKRLSAMISGNKAFTVKCYPEIHDAFHAIDQFITEKKSAVLSK